jgi:hypothetical protein
VTRAGLQRDGLLLGWGWQYCMEVVSCHLTWLSPPRGPSEKKGRREGAEAENWPYREGRRTCRDSARPKKSFRAALHSEPAARPVAPLPLFCHAVRWARVHPIHPTAAAANSLSPTPAFSFFLPSFLALNGKVRAYSPHPSLTISTRARLHPLIPQLRFHSSLDFDLSSVQLPLP